MERGELTLETGVLELPTEMLQIANLVELIGRRVAVLRNRRPLPLVSDS